MDIDSYQVTIKRLEYGNLKHAIVSPYKNPTYFYIGKNLRDRFNTLIMQSNLKGLRWKEILKIFLWWISK